jgi:hypothetical protein
MNSRKRGTREPGHVLASRRGVSKPRSFLFALLAAASIPLAPVVRAEQPLVPSNGTWKRISDFSPAENAAIDWRSETPRDADIPYLPAERYPFEAPFSAEKLGYRVMNFSHNARWPHTMADSLGSITKAGYLSQSTTVLRMGVFSDGEGVPGHIATAPGKDFLRMFYYYTYPPKDQGMQGMWSYRRTDKAHKTKIDNFMYFPALRRVRRLPQPRRDAPIQGAVQSVDDVVGRDAWEFSWRIIGSDVLYETVRFPATRPTLTLAHSDGTFFDVPTADLAIMGDDYPFYTEDGGVACYVLVAEPRKDWLPDYSASKIVYWIDRHYFYPVRIEQYGAEGELRNIQVRLAKLENPALGPEGHTNLLTVYWDANLDLITYSLHDAHKIVEWTGAEKAVMFSADFMRRRWLKYRQRTLSLVDSPKEFYLRPSLEPGKWPEERRLELAPDLEARIRAQDAAGHLVFATSEENPAER